MLQLRFVIRERGVGENEKEEKIGKTEILVLNVMEWGGGGSRLRFKRSSGKR